MYVFLLPCLLSTLSDQTRRESLKNETKADSVDNHKTDASSSQNLHLLPSDSPSSYDLSLSAKNDTYRYNGTRTSGDGQYVLIFDPAKKHFVLHRIDSTFDMNLVSTPQNSDEASLRTQYTQFEAPPVKQSASQSSEDQEARQPRTSNKSVKNIPAAPAKPDPKRKKQAPVPAPAPKAAPKKTKISIREPTPEEEDEEDSDDGLTVEYPDGGPSQNSNFRFQSTPVVQREASEEMSDEDSDAEFEEDDVPMGGNNINNGNEQVDHLKLPSPANIGGMSDEEMELDLEAELEQALMSEAGPNESSESEEE